MRVWEIRSGSKTESDSEWTKEETDAYYCGYYKGYEEAMEKILGFAHEHKSKNSEAKKKYPWEEKD